jgi:hypothetical protein
MSDETASEPRNSPVGCAATRRFYAELAQSSQAADSTAIGAFLARAYTRSSLQSDSFSGVVVEVMPSWKQDVYFHPEKWLRDGGNGFELGMAITDGWNRFYREFPRTPGFIWVSRVGFNRDQSEAYVYVTIQTRSLSGEGRVFLLSKVGRHWVIKDNKSVWQERLE